MHVVHYNLTTTTKEGGVETFVWDLAAEQARRGYKVSIIGGHGNVRRDVAGVHVATVPFVDRSRFALGVFKRAYAWRKLAERLSMVPRALPLVRTADLVHIHKPYDLVLAPLLKKRGIPVVYHGHGEDFFRGDQRLMKDVPALLSCSSYNAATLKQRYGRDATIVYNGVDVDHFQPQTPDLALRNQFAPNGEFVVMQTGRMMPWKGHATTLESIAELDSRFRLILIGDGETRHALVQQAHDLDIADRVIFCGTIPHRDMPRYLACADVVVGASYASETFGMALSEAQACNRAVIASSWRGFDDVVQHEQTGLRFEMQHPASLAHAIQRLHDEPDLKHKLAHAGRERTITLFSWSAVADRVDAVYEKIVNSCPEGTQ